MPIALAAVIAESLLTSFLIGGAIALILGIVAYIALKRFLNRYGRAIMIGLGGALALTIGGLMVLQGGALRAAGVVVLIVVGFFLWAMWSHRGHPKNPARGKGPGA